MVLVRTSGVVLLVYFSDKLGVDANCRETSNTFKYPVQIHIWLSKLWFLVSSRLNYQATYLSKYVLPMQLLAVQWRKVDD